MDGKMNIKPNAFQKLMHRLLMLKPISALMAKILHRVDALLLRVTHDRHTLTEIVGLPVLQLITIGAKTGQQRVIPLVGLADEKKIALIASNFGGRHNPGWYHNLKARPECTVKFSGRTGTYIAREAHGEEREKYWQMAVSYYAGYEKYKERTGGRIIPVMVLESQ